MHISYYYCENYKMDFSTQLVRSIYTKVIGKNFHPVYYSYVKMKILFRYQNILFLTTKRSINICVIKL